MKFLKIGLLYCFFSLCTTHLMGQITLSGNVSFPPDAYRSVVLDQTNQNIYYTYTYVENPQKTQQKSSSLTLLQVGPDYAKFMDFYTLKKDSLQESFSHLKSIDTNELNKLLAVQSKIGFETNIIRNLHKKKIVFQSNIAAKRYFFKEKAPEISWKLTNEYREIMGHKTQKATTAYSGRKWVAWFAKAIPINLGPYIFGNLPGLILELYDTENNFHFTATGINTEQHKIYKRNEVHLINTTKDKFYKAQQNYHARPGLYHKNSTIDLDETKEIPYNPIELMYE